MNAISKIVFTLFIMLNFVSILNAQSDKEYKWLHPTPQGNTLYWVKMFDANNWYAMGEGATFLKTSNAGSSWVVKNNIAYGNDSVTPIIIYDAHFFDMNTGFACGEGGKLLKTTNGGETWDASVPLASGAIWRDMYWIDATTGFMCGSNNNRVAKTTDGGATWSQVGSPPSGTVFYSIYASDTNNIICSTSGSRIRRTTNGGSSWQSINPGSGTGAQLYKINFYNDTCGYYCGTAGDIRMTTDFGSTWTDLGLGGGGFRDIDFLTVVNTTYVYITGNNSRIYMSEVGSVTWDTVPFRPESQVIGGQYYTTDLSVTGNSLITAGENGLFNVRYGPSNKAALTDYIKNNALRDIWADSDTGRVIAVGDAGQDQVMYSTNGGTDWHLSNYSSVDNQNLYNLHMVNTMTGYVTGTSGEVGKTTDGGVTWELKSPDPTSQSYNVFFLNENTGWVFSENNDRNYKTTNGGDNWTTFNWGGSDPDFAISGYFLDENTGWIGGLRGILYKTTDGGATTERQDTGLDTVNNNPITDIQMLNSNTGWLTGYFAGQLRKTTNGGSTWDTINVPYSSDVWSIHFIDEWNGMATGSDGLMFRTRDGGQTWETGNTSGTIMNGVYMTSTNSAFVCGNNAAIFKYEETLTGTELTFSNEVPSNFILEQNYPNPFNPATTIKFGLPGNGMVSLKVYDITGREVAALINNQMMNAGQVTQRFDGSNLSSGVYFYSLAVDGQLVGTKKMILVK